MYLYKYLFLIYIIYLVSSTFHLLNKMYVSNECLTLKIVKREKSKVAARCKNSGRKFRMIESDFLILLCPSDATLISFL